MIESRSRGQPEPTLLLLQKTSHTNSKHFTTTNVAVAAKGFTVDDVPNRLLPLPPPPPPG